MGFAKRLKISNLLMEFFKYPRGLHNVVRVNGSDFQQCVTPASASTEALDSGNDEIVLSSPGTKWYISDIGKHCDSDGMKLAITVIDSSAFSPSPTPTSSAATTSSLFYSACMMLAFGSFAVIIWVKR